MNDDCYLAASWLGTSAQQESGSNQRVPARTNRVMVSACSYKAFQASVIPSLISKASSIGASNPNAVRESSADNYDVGRQLRC